MDYTISKDEVLSAGKNRAIDVLTNVALLPADILDGRHHPCPKCSGKDRFRMIDRDAGAVICNQCLPKAEGNFIGATMWARDLDFVEALKICANYLGVQTPESTAERDIILEVCRAKRMPVDAFLKFGAVAAKRGKLTVARVPAYNERGDESTYFDLTATNQKGWFKKGVESGIFLPGQKPEPDETWLLVEGVKDASALVGLEFLACGLPTSSMNAKFTQLFKGTHVVVIPDLDTAGLDGANLTAARLFGICESVRIGRLPGEIRGSGGDDVRDVLSRENGEQIVRDTIANADEWTPPAADGGDGEQPEIELRMDESRVVDEVLSVIGNVGWTLRPNAEHLRTYQRAGGLVHVVVDASPLGDIRLPDDTRRIRPVPASLIRERISASARLYVWEDTDEGPQRSYRRTPDWLIKMIAERGQYSRDSVRPITGVITSPTMRADGTIIQQSGYDPRTGLLVELTGDWPSIKELPTQTDARRAADELLNTIRDFPFADDSHRSGWLALVLTLIGRPAIDGPIPLFVVDANTRGSGKSLLVDAAGVIATSKQLPRKTWPPDDAEIRKTITAVALEALPVVMLDNIVGRLGSASLDAALTGTTWTDRLLGVSKTTGILPLATTWVATGNNLELAFDTARRTLLLRLESDLENPEERVGFEHPNLLAWVTKERKRLATAALVVLRGYVAAGRPDQHLSPWGSFEAWSNLVRSAIVWTGLPDPADTRQIVRDADRSVQLLRLILEGVREAGNQATTAELIRLVSHPVGPDCHDAYPALRAAVGEICGDKLSTPKLGAALRANKGRICGGRRLTKRDGTGHVAIWTVEEVTNRGHEGHEGHDLDPSRARSQKVCPDKPDIYKTDVYPETAETCPPSPSSPLEGTWGEI